MPGISINAVPRRAFLRTVAATALGLRATAAAPSENAEAQIVTVLGTIPARDLGVTLPHEHCVVDFIGAEKAPQPRYDSETAFASILPHLKTLRSHGCRSLVECTPNYIGRNVRLLERLSRASGVHILTNTGYYGAGRNKFIPQHAFTATAEELSVRWLEEWEKGIEGTGIRPGFIKLGVEKGKLSDLHVKLVRAAARVHLRSGLTIAIHSGDGEAALDELRVLQEEGVGASALIWVHAQNDPGPIQVEMARRGAWVSLDGYSARHHERYRDWLLDYRKQNLLGRLLISHDHFWSVQGEGATTSLTFSGGENASAFEPIFTRLLPALRKAEFSEAEIRQLTVINPREAFAIRVREPSSAR